MLQGLRKSIIPTDRLAEAAAENRSLSSAHFLCTFFHCSVWKYLSACPYASNFSFPTRLDCWLLWASSNRTDSPARAQPPPAASQPSKPPPAAAQFRQSSSAVRTLTAGCAVALRLQSCPWLWESKCPGGNAEFWDHGWYHPASAAPRPVTPVPHHNGVVASWGAPLSEGKAKMQQQWTIHAVLPAKGSVLHPAKSAIKLLVIGTSSHWMVRGRNCVTVMLCFGKQNKSSFWQWQLFCVLAGKRNHIKNAQKEMRMLLQKSDFHTGNVDED